MPGLLESILEHEFDLSGLDFLKTQATRESASFDHEGETGTIGNGS